MSEPETEAGRALLARLNRTDNWRNDAGQRFILAIEAEVRATLAAKVRALPLYDQSSRTMADAAESMRDRAAALIEVSDE